ncbi:MAG: hypothetical protein OXR68_08230 [Alphaproteobacteria bacterium]|nr:hypothetical protein [Alphaproteobacteria bacterium]MDD9920592.1 hypothetical protein [Alphaproteobacteria bacterium]
MTLLSFLISTLVLISASIIGSYTANSDYFKKPDANTFTVPFVIAGLLAFIIDIFKLIILSDSIITVSTLVNLLPLHIAVGLIFGFVATMVFVACLQMGWKSLPAAIGLGILAIFGSLLITATVLAGFFYLSGTNSPETVQLDQSAWITICVYAVLTACLFIYYLGLLKLNLKHKKKHPLIN